MMKVGEFSLEAAVERSHDLAWWQFLLVFMALQVLVVVIFRQSSKMLSEVGNGGGKIRPALSRLLSIPSMSRHADVFYSPLQRSPSISPKRFNQRL